MKPTPFALSLGSKCNILVGTEIGWDYWENYIPNTKEKMMINLWNLTLWEW